MEGSSRAERIRIGTLQKARAALHTCQPSISGIIRSRTIMRGECSLIISKTVRAAVRNQHVKTAGGQEHGKQVRDGGIVVYSQHKRVHIFAHGLLSWISCSLSFASNLQIERCYV